MELAGETAMAQGVSGPALGVRSRDWVESEFESVFFQYYTRVVQVLYRMLGDRAQAEEVASDAFMKLFEQQAPLAAYQNLGGWLYRTATRMGIDSLRSAARRRHYEPQAAEGLVGASDSSSPLDQVLRAERQGAVRAALARLKPVQAQLLMLRSSGLSYKEVAEALSINVTSVGAMLVRAEAAFEKAYRRTQKSRQS